MYYPMQPGMPNGMVMNPMFGLGGVNPGFPSQSPSPNLMGGNWAASYNPMNMNNLNNMNNNMNMQQSPGKMNVVFKTTNGNIKNVQIDIGKTIGELIILYLKRMDRENLIGNERDICFLYDATKLKYNYNRRVEQVFRFVNPCIMVNDVQNLIGAI